MATSSYIFIFLLLLSCLLTSQTPDLQFEHITVEDGLSNNYITSILQDSSGFMWFGTFDGLNRWDGHSFRVFKWDPTDSNSISASHIRTLLQASSGKIWVGTNDGLNRYDPETENFTRYEIEKYDSDTPHDNIIHDLYEDKSGNLWIATSPGLNLYNANSNEFTRFMVKSRVTEQNRSYNYILSICPYRDGKMLLGTTAGLLIFDPKTTQFKRVLCPYEIPRTPVVNWWWPINKIHIDRKGTVWIGMDSGGLVKFNPESGHSRLFSRDSNDPSNFSAYNVSALCETQTGVLWVGSFVDGLNRLEPGSEQFTVYKFNHNDNKSINSSKISALYEDNQGNLWIGTQDKGINLLAKWRKRFDRYAHEPGNPQSIGDCEVTDICEDQRGSVWITTYGSDLSVLNPKTGNITKYLRDFNDPKSISQPFLRTVYCDRSGTIWIGAMSLNRYNPYTNGFIKYHNDYFNPQSHGYASIVSIYEDRHGRMWLGTMGEGLELFDRTKGIFHRYRHDPKNANSLPYNDVLSIYQDHFGILWIGTGKGLCRLILDEKGNEQFITYQHDTSDPYYIRRNVIIDIFEDSNKRLWLATAAGIMLYDREKDDIRLLNSENGFPINWSVFSIKEDDHKNLWLRTSKGLIKFDPENYSYRIYDERDGLKNAKSIFQGFQAFYKSKTGTMYYGDANDIVHFHPDSIKDNPAAPKILLTNFRLFNRLLPIGPNSILKKSITFTRTIRLSHIQNNISFEFAALDFTAPGKNQYAYKMEGIDREWIYGGNRHFANYTNLDPGEYFFHVKGSNNDGVWNEKGASLRIIVTPPWWKTNWAYAIYGLFIISVIMGTWRFQMNRVKMKHDLEMEHLHTEKLEEVDRVKSRFFANISHEFRTPLTLILGPLEHLLSRSIDKESSQEMKIMQRSARRLQRLINQLLDLSKLEAGRMKLLVRQENVVTLLRSFVQAFESLAKLKKIKLIFNSVQENIPAYIDREKLETIVNNILSNAFRFTPEGGTVVVDLSLPPLSIPPLDKGGKAEGVAIKVSDTGCGIPADRLPHIFDRFYRGDDAVTIEPAPLESRNSKNRPVSDELYTTGQEGTGIGLALTKELVEFHKGEITVASEMGKGTTFVVRLPLGMEHYTAEEIVDLKEAYIEADDRGNRRPETGNRKLKISPEPNKREIPTGEKFNTSRKSLPILHIVEDNSDMRQYIRSNLENGHRIIESENGEDGFKKCTRRIPDLVISDVMMPRMNGFQLCAKLKTDQRTSHIPVILLTARAASEDRIGGLETGADDYIIKPFEARELRVRVKNLIEQRRKLRERFRKEGNLQSQEIKVTSTDQKFLEKARAIVNTYLSDPEFNTHIFAREVGMSRMQLHRKMTALTDMAPKEFIRTTRLQRAAQLLQQKFGNVTEVAYEVGFNNPAYFTECFRKRFGVTPLTFLKKEPLKQ